MPPRFVCRQKFNVSLKVIAESLFKLGEEDIKNEQNMLMIIYLLSIAGRGTADWMETMQ